MKKRIICLLALMALLVMVIPMNVAAAEVNVQEVFAKKQHTMANGYTLNYRIYIPADYDAEKEYPLILFFHGAGSKGNDNECHLNTGIPNMFKSSGGRVDQSIIIAPQCPLLTPDTAKWVNVPNWVDGCSYSSDAIPESLHMKAVVEVLEEVKQTYSTDERRWYVTGLSMGGFATWDILVRHTELWAAAVPVCGGADYRKADKLVDMPIWTFHGLKDPTVPYAGTEKMVNTLMELGSTKIKYNPMPESQHNIWNSVYSLPTLYSWMFSQTRPEPVEETDPDVETTAAPEEVTTAAQTEAVTTAVQTNAVITPAGCGGVIGSCAAAVTVAAGAVLLHKRKKEYDE